MINTYTLSIPETIIYKRTTETGADGSETQTATRVATFHDHEAGLAYFASLNPPAGPPGV